MQHSWRGINSDIFHRFRSIVKNRNKYSYINVTAAQLKTVVDCKMVILEINKIFRNFIGLRFVEQSRYRKYILVVVPNIVFGVMLLIDILLFINVFANIGNNIQAALPSVAPFFDCFANTVTYWHFWKHFDDFYALFDAIQGIVNESRLRCVIIISVMQWN